MAKSKKRHTNKKKQPKKTAPSRLRLIKGRLLATMPPKTLFKPYNEGKISRSLVYNSILDRLLMTPKDLNNTDDMIYKAIAPTLTREMRNADINPKLNMYVNVPGFDFDKTADTLDFTEYEGDVIADASEIISADPNAALIYSTSEFVKIKPYEAVEYRIQRIDYDPTDESVGYEIQAYETTTVVNCNNITLPLFIVAGRAKITTVSEVQMAASRALLVSDLTTSSAKNDKAISIPYSFARSSLSNIKERAGDDHVLTFETYGTLFTADTYQHMVSKLGIFSAYSPDDIWKSINMAPTSLANMLLGLNRDGDNIIGITDEHNNISKGSKEMSYAIMDYMVQRITSVIAYIIIANKMLKDRKLSHKSYEPMDVKPKTTTQVIGHEIATTDESDTRRTHILGGSIKITSNTKPTAPNIEKIIKYKMAEWGRKKHLRHYKNGKIVEIKAATVQRKCVDINDNGKSSTQNGVDYIVKKNKKGG